jgi:hypothetical protein
MQMSNFSTDELRLLKTVIERVSLEVSLRNLFLPLDLIASRLYSAVANGERDEETLRQTALIGASQAPPPLPVNATF